MSRNTATCWRLIDVDCGTSEILELAERSKSIGFKLSLEGWGLAWSELDNFERYYECAENQLANCYQGREHSYKCSLKWVAKD